MALSKEKRKAYVALLDTLPKRPRAVLEKILEKGSVSTYELGLLGYDQPPRAAQDLKEHGVRLRVKSGSHPKTGNRMAIYSLDDSATDSTWGGRRVFPPKFRADVEAKYGTRCNLCDAPYQKSWLSLDHRIPYIVAGETAALNVSDFQPLCGSHQRKKSWACEHCPNRELKDIDTCRTCFWAFPETEFKHVATEQIRWLDVTFSGSDDIALYDGLREDSVQAGTSLGELVKQIVRDFAKRRR